MIRAVDLHPRAVGDYHILGHSIAGSIHFVGFLDQYLTDKLRDATVWTVQRRDGGRGFGFTGGHFHDNWGNDNFRKVVLNALLWIAKVEVPEDGVDSTVTAGELDANLDPKRKR